MHLGLLVSWITGKYISVTLGNNFIAVKGTTLLVLFCTFIVVIVGTILVELIACKRKYFMKKKNVTRISNFTVWTMATWNAYLEKGT